jgi:hypothetical protein
MRVARKVAASMARHKLPQDRQDLRVVIFLNHELESWGELSYIGVHDRAGVLVGRVWCVPVGGS